MYSRNCNKGDNQPRLDYKQLSLHQTIANRETTRPAQVSRTAMLHVDRSLLTGDNPKGCNFARYPWEGEATEWRVTAEKTLARATTFGDLGTKMSAGC